MTTMPVLYTASARGAVHLVRDGSARTFCGKRPSFTPTLPWPRWALDQASLDVRQRRMCDACAAAARPAR